MLNERTVLSIKEVMTIREVLYKAKKKNWRELPIKEQWVEGFYCCRQETTYCFEEDYERFPVRTLHFIIQERMTDWGLPNTFSLIEIDPETLCQFTGLVDKNEKKVFENDIHLDKEEELASIVKWDNENARFVLEDYGIAGCLMEYGWDETMGDFGKLDTNGFDAFNHPLDWFEVVGNKFDNLEMLKGEVKIDIS